MRYALVMISLLIVLLILRIPLKIHRKGIPFLLISGVLMATYNFTFLQGLKSGSPGAGGILVTTLNPIVAYGIGMLLARKMPGINETIGLLLGIIAGVVLLEIWQKPDILSNKGNVYFLLSALIWAVMSKFTSNSAKYGSAFAFTWWMYIVTMVVLLPFAHWPAITHLLTEEKNMHFWGNLLFGSVITTTGATTVYFFATSRIGAEKASSFIFIVPLCAALSAAILLNEHILLHSVIGGVLGIGAVYAINTRRFSKRNE
jgi:drug/metabolite transporter (DMT)-like permease